MNKPLILAFTAIAVVGTLAASGYADEETAESYREPAEAQIPAPCEFYFHSSNVVEAFCYGADEPWAYYVCYDCPDAGMDYEVVRVSQQAYGIIQDAQENGCEIDGYLVPSRQDDAVVFSFSPDTEII